MLKFYAETAWRHFLKTVSTFQPCNLSCYITVFWYSSYILNALSFLLISSFFLLYSFSILSFIFAFSFRGLISWNFLPKKRTKIYISWSSFYYLFEWKMAFCCVRHFFGGWFDTLLYVVKWQCLEEIRRIFSGHCNRSMSFHQFINYCCQHFSLEISLRQLIIIFKK